MLRKPTTLFFGLLLFLSFDLFDSYKIRLNNPIIFFAELVIVLVLGIYFFIKFLRFIGILPDNMTLRDIYHQDDDWEENPWPGYFSFPLINDSMAMNWYFRCLVFVISGAISGLFMTFMGFNNINDYAELFKGKEWEVTQCKITRTFIAKPEYARFTPEAEYIYSVDGNTYNGSTYSLTDQTESYEYTAQKKLDKMPIGKTVKCHYNAKNPTESAINIDGPSFGSSYLNKKIIGPLIGGILFAFNLFLIPYFFRRTFFRD